MYLYAEPDGLAVRAHGNSPAAAFLSHIARHWPTRRWVTQRRVVTARQFADTTLRDSLEQELWSGLAVVAAHQALMLTTVPELRWFTMPHALNDYGAADLEHRMARIVPGMALAPGHLALCESRALAVPSLHVP